MVSTVKVTNIDTPDNTGNVTFDRPIVGDGSGLTSLPAANLTGTVAGARLPDPLPAIDGSNLTGVSGGKVLQVVQNHVNTISSQSLTATTFANISNLNASITPSSSSSKILVKIRWAGEIASHQDVVFGINRDSTSVGSAPSVGSRPFGLTCLGISYQAENSSTPESANYEYIDSPGDTSAHTYHATVKHESSQAFYNNRTISDTDNNSRPRLTSTITLIELESATTLLNGA